MFNVLKSQYIKIKHSLVLREILDRIFFVWLIGFLFFSFIFFSFGGGMTGYVILAVLELTEIPTSAS